MSGLAACHSKPKGLSDSAYEELEAAGVNKYLGQFTPVSSKKVGGGWIKHTFDSAAGEGPVCITGTDYSVFTRKGNTKQKLLIFLQGGGACWQGVTQCNLFAEDQEQPFPDVGSDGGIWDLRNKDNPFHNYSVVYMPYCDGSEFTGDNDVVDPDFAADLAARETPILLDEPIRYHRGLRNLSAGMDVARARFPNPQKLTVAGSSAGGVGAASLAPFLARFEYGNWVKKFTVFNDAGPGATYPDAVVAGMARSADWNHGQFFPESCTECDPLGGRTPLIEWRLANDSRVREAFYSTDGDAVGIVFTSLNLPGSPALVPFDPENGIVGLDHASYRDLLLPEHDRVNANYPDRYKRFIVSGDDSHTALQTDLFYSQDADGTLLNEWTRSFLGDKRDWVDIVEDFVPLP